MLQGHVTDNTQQQTTKKYVILRFVKYISNY